MRASEPSSSSTRIHHRPGKSCAVPAGSDQKFLILVVSRLVGLLPPTAFDISLVKERSTDPELLEYNV